MEGRTFLVALAMIIPVVIVFCVFVRAVFCAMRKMLRARRAKRRPAWLAPELEPVPAPAVPCSCEATVEPYLRNELSRRELILFWGHLLGCERCWQKATQLEGIRVESEGPLYTCPYHHNVVSLYGEYTKKGRWVSEVFVHLRTCTACQAYVLWLGGEVLRKNKDAKEFEEAYRSVQSRAR